MKNNSVVLLLGGVHACSANHAIREFKVRIYNSVDLLPGACPQDHNDEEIPGYKEAEALEELLGNLRSNISVCYHGVGIDVTLLEEELHAES